MTVIQASVTSKANSSAGSSDSMTAAGDVPVGSGLVAVLFIKDSSAPTFSSFTDSAGNSYTVDGQDIATNQIVIGRCASTTAAITGGTTTYSWAVSGGTMQEACFVVVPSDVPLGSPGTVTFNQVSGSDTYSQTITPANDTDTLLWVFGRFAATSSATKSGDGGVAAFIASAGRGLSVGDLAPAGGTAAKTQTIKWSSVGFAVTVGLAYPQGSISGGTTKSSTDSITYDDSTSTLLIDDGTADVTYSESSALAASATSTEALAWSDSTAVSVGPSTSDTHTWADISDLTILDAPDITSSDLHQWVDLSSLNSSLFVESSDQATLTDEILLVEAATAGSGLGTVTVVSPVGTVVITPGSF